MTSMQASAIGDQPPVTLRGWGNLEILDHRRVARRPGEVFISVVHMGAEVCTAVVHVHDHIVLGVTAREILDRACAWKYWPAGANGMST